MAWEPLPTAEGGTKDPQQLRAGLDRVVQSLGMPSTSALEKLFHRWADIVGPELAGQCRPVKLDKGRLIIEAPDRAWATELRWLESSLVERCAEAVGVGVVTSVLIHA